MLHLDHNFVASFVKMQRKIEEFVA